MHRRSLSGGESRVLISQVGEEGKEQWDCPVAVRDTLRPIAGAIRLSVHPSKFSPIREVSDQSRHRFSTRSIGPAMPVMRPPVDHHC
jgi:hypothetical protein